MRAPSGPDADIVARSGNHISGQGKLANELKTSLGALRRDIDGHVSPRLLTFFSTDTPTTSSTGFMHPWFYPAAYTSTERVILLPSACTARNLYARVRTVGSGTGSLLVTVLRNGANTSLTTTFKAVAAGGNNRRDTVRFEAGDYISVSVGDIGTVTSPVDLTVSLEVY
jgi:hypothetical protein